MATSVSDLKSRLRTFLADPQTDKDFHSWFAVLLMDVHQQKNQELEDLAYAVRRAFSDAAEGVYSPQELRSLLSDFAGQEEESIQWATVAARIDIVTESLFPYADVNVSPASPLPYLSPSGALIPSFYSVPEPVSIRDEHANFWGTAEPAQRQSAA